MLDEKNRLPNGSGYWEARPGAWWAVYRRGTANWLVGVYKTSEEARVAYLEAQDAWDNRRRDEYGG